MVKKNPLPRLWQGIKHWIKHYNWKKLLVAVL